MSNLSRSATSIGQKVQELKSCDPKDETGELVLTSRIDGGVVFIDGAPVGVVGSKIPYTAPFLGIGYHFVEVRKPAMARWGEVVEIKPRLDLHNLAPTCHGRLSNFNKMVTNPQKRSSVRNFRSNNTNWCSIDEHHPPINP